MKSDGRLLPFLGAGPGSRPVARPERRANHGDGPPPARPDLDRGPALERWWSELPTAERRLALSLRADAVLPEELVVSLLLHGALTPGERPPAGGVGQPRELQRFLARQAVRD